MKKTIIACCLLVAYSCLAMAQIAKADKQRLIVTTDLGGSDPDDIQSMIHLLLCSNTIDIEGLISSNAWWDDPDRTHRIREIVEEFGKVLPRLNLHAKGWPTLEHLRSIVKRGQSKAHMSGVGEGKDSPGSELIIQTVDKKNDPRPVWLTAWGGMNTIAQAVWKVHQTRTPKEFQQFASKIRIYDILGQDDAGAWIAKNFPGIIYIRNKEVYAWNASDEWLKEHIQRPNSFGKLYPDRIWTTEGDSPSFLHVYANGLNVPDSLHYGGWGGRFSKQKMKNIRGMDFIERSGKNETQYHPYYMHGSCKEGSMAIIKWKTELWNDFAARIQWSATDRYADANHHPIAAIGKDRSLRCIFKRAKAGQTLLLDACKSADPDGDKLSYRWSFYAEPSSYRKEVKITQKKTTEALIHIPADAAGKNIHIILEVTDNGTPALTGYRRIVIQVKP